MPTVITRGGMSSKAFGFTSGSPLDPYFNNTTLLLHGNGTNGAQNNTFLDSSTNNFTITRNGNTTQGTFTPFSQPNGWWSNYFNGSTDYVSCTSGSSAFNVGTSDFTVEGWIYQNSRGTNPTILDNGSVTFYVTTDGYLSAYTVTYGSQTSSTVVPLNSWSHFAFVRASGVLNIYMNGVLTFSGTHTINYSPGNTFTIGNNGGSAYFNGYISNMRIVKNTAVYTSNFTPSTLPLTAVANTSLLTCQSNRFLDNSTNAFTITPTGTPSVQNFYPFTIPPVAYSASGTGGSAYFDGSGDYLTLPAGSSWLFTADHCLEAWVYLPISGSAIIYATGNVASSDQFGFFTGGEGIWWGQTSQSSSVLPTINAWSHLCVTRQGSTIRRFLNGQLITTATVSGNIGSNSATPYIGQRPSGGENFTGNIASLRIINGSVPTDYQTSNTTINAQIFTPPTAPVTTTSQGATSGDVKLLLSCTNGAIFDNASKNDLETVGNAQISTTQSKFGGSSMYFDGTGDWLTAADAPDLQLGSANFTIEGWIYINSTGTAYGIVSKGTSTTGWSVNITSGNKIQFSYTSSNVTGATSLSANTWYHFAAVRNGSATGNLQIYLNGTSDVTSSGAVTDSFTQTSILYVGADRTGGSSLNGYIDDLRITNGIARYTANFTVPNAPFPNR